MTLIFNAKAFDKIRPTSFPLPRWKKPFALIRQAKNPLAVVLHFAGRMGLTELPARTAQKLREDPYFRYAFWPVVWPVDPYDSRIPFAQQEQKRMGELLKDPDLFNDQDLYQGISLYLNNFTQYLPGGIYRDTSWLDPRDRRAMEPITDAVDRALRQLGKRKKEVLSLRTQYSKRAEFMKLALAVFNIVVEKDKFDPAELWH